MVARCPKDPSHTRFITVAHVMQDWLVEADGEFIESLEDLEVSHKPDPDNIWTCAICGEEAVHD